MSRHWLEPDGGLSPPVGEASTFMGFRVDPTGGRVAFSQVDSMLGTFDIWVHDVGRNLSTRFTFDSESEGWPIWSPDGHWLAYASDQDGHALLRKPLSGIGEPDTLLTGTQDMMPLDWSPDGSTICYATVDTTGNVDLLLVPADGSGTPRPFRATKFNEQEATFSPDGRWLAYTSTESGSYEVFVESVTPGRGRWRVSADSGSWPAWSPGGDRLYYLSLQGELMATEVEEAAGALRLGRTVSITDQTQIRTAFNTYDIDPATGRILLERPTTHVRHSNLALVTGWAGMLGGS
jgi:Tol biopolymer transport system component